MTLAWVVRVLGPGWRVVGGRRMTGGVTSSMHRLSVEHRSGAHRQVVLRRWIGGEYDEGETPADRVNREVAVLGQLATTDIPCPEVLGSDPTGADAEIPCVLMTRVPGHVHLTPGDRHDWLARMAVLLVRIHETVVDAPPYFSWLDHIDVPFPPWTSERDAWRVVIDTVNGPAPSYEARFVHRDYQHFNLLWQHERLTGIVDWVYACSGPPDVDVGHCRINLAILYAAEWAEDFLRAYEAEAGRRVDPYWDLSELVPPTFYDWGAFIPLQVAGRAPFDRAGMHARIDELVAAAVRRL